MSNIISEGLWIAHQNVGWSKMPRVGAWVAAQTILGRITPYDIEKLYDRLAAQQDREPANENSRAVQVSKLNVFRRFGRTFGHPAVVWLAHRIDTNMSPRLYEDMIFSMRKMLRLKRMF